MSEVYEKDSTFWAYVKWHYSQGLRELFSVAHNFLWFITHFFSFKLLLRTLFAPWKRMGETYAGGFKLEEWASTLVVNSLMRLVGFCTKALILIVGLASYIFVLAVSFLVILIWLLAPAVLIGSTILSVTFFVI